MTEVILIGVVFMALIIEASVFLYYRKLKTKGARQ